MTPMTTVDLVVARLQALKGKWRKVASGSGVPYRTLKKIADGTVRNPGARTLEPIARFLEQHTDLQ
jgi:hypothetical protein